MLLIGKTALARGLPMDVYAFPDVGVPNYSPIGPQVDRCMVYSIVRTESGFDQGDLSSAKAVGLKQVTPVAGRDTAKRFGVTYDWNRLVSDPWSGRRSPSSSAEILLLALRRLKNSFFWLAVVPSFTTCSWIKEFFGTGRQ
jgi:hypothetical protein